MRKLFASKPLKRTPDMSKADLSLVDGNPIYTVFNFIYIVIIQQQKKHTE